MYDPSRPLYEPSSDHCRSQEFLYYEPRENDKHLSATLNNILQRPRRNTPKLVKQTYSVVSVGDLCHGKKLLLTLSVPQFVSLPDDRPLGIQRKWHISKLLLSLSRTRH